MKQKKFKLTFLVAVFIFSIGTACSEKKIGQNVVASPAPTKNSNEAKPVATPCTDPSKDPSIELKKQNEVEEFSLTNQKEGCKLK